MNCFACALISVLGASLLLACGGATGDADGQSSTGGSTNASGSGSASTGTGGTGIGGAGTGGASSGGSAALDCSPISPCGGELLGRWKVVDYCPPTASTVPECTGVIADESVIGDFFYVFEADGVLRVEGTPVLTVDVSASEACTKAMGYSDAAAYCAEVTAAETEENVTRTCSASEGRCDCHTEIEQLAGVPEQTYSASDGVLRIGFEAQPALVEGAYCVTGDSLRFQTSAEAGSAMLLVRE